MTYLVLTINYLCEVNGKRYEMKTYSVSAELRNRLTISVSWCARMAPVICREKKKQSRSSVILPHILKMYVHL
jgi:hypothetical protein